MRFQQVLFIADFRLTAEDSYIYINEDLNVDPDDRARFITFLYRSSVLKLLVQLLANSPSLHPFSISLDVEV